MQHAYLDYVQDVNYQAVTDSLLGMLKFEKGLPLNCRLADFPISAQELINSSEVIMLGKTNIRSTVHRPT